MCCTFFKKYRDYVDQTNGGAAGSNKTTKGQPDFILKKKDSPAFILVECTTQIDNLEKRLDQMLKHALMKEKVESRLS